MSRSIIRRPHRVRALLLAAVMMFLVGCSCETPPSVKGLVVADDGRAFAGVSDWGDRSITQWFVTDDEGLSWQPTAENPIVADPVDEICSERGFCYRAVGRPAPQRGLDIIEQSVDAGEWNLAWNRAAIRPEFFSSGCVTPFDVQDMAIIDGDSDHVLLVAATAGGVLRRDRDGSWSQTDVGAAMVTSLSGQPPALLTLLLAIATATVAVMVFLVVLISLGARKMRFGLSAGAASAAVATGLVVWWLIYALWAVSLIDRWRVASTLATVLALGAALVIAVVAHVRLGPQHLKPAPTPIIPTVQPPGSPT